MATFAKTLTKNDLGETGAHQAGVHIPKGNIELIKFLPSLDPSIKNSDCWVSCVDDLGGEWRLRYIHYNNKLHSPNGTRDEYRITHILPFFRAADASAGDSLLISRCETSGRYFIRIERKTSVAARGEKSIVRLRGWRKIH